MRSSQIDDKFTLSGSVCKGLLDCFENEVRVQFAYAASTEYVAKLFVILGLALCHQVHGASHHEALNPFSMKCFDTEKST